MQKRKLFHAVACAVAITLVGCGAGPSVTRSAPVHHKAKVFEKAKPSSERATTPKTKPERSAPQKTQAEPDKAAPNKKIKTEKCDAACERRREIAHNFFISVVEGDLKDVKRMLRKRRVSLKDLDMVSLLSVSKHPRMIRFLLRHVADVNSTNSDGETVLMMAAFDGNYHKVRILIKHGADVKIKNTKANSSAISYCTNGKIARLLIKKGADVNEVNIYGTTPLIYATSRGCNDVAKVLLDNGADVNVNSPVVGTALMLASRFGNVELVKLLLLKGANVNAVGTDYFDRKKAKKTALQLARENKSDEIVNILEKHGAK